MSWRGRQLKRPRIFIFLAASPLVRPARQNRHATQANEFPVKFNIKLVHKASLAYQFIFNFCFRRVQNDLLPRENKSCHTLND